MLKTLQGENLQLLSQDLGPVSALRVDLLLVQIESCFRLCAICGSCSTNSLLIFLSARWGSDVSMCSPACMCVCVYYMFCAFWILLGVWFNQATPLTLARTQPPAHSHNHLHTPHVDPDSVLPTFPGCLISSIAITCGWTVLNQNLSRGSAEC